jgi:F420-0:gamma-glutamyl ligase-like protein
MINSLLDGLKGIGKFLGIIIYAVGFLPFKLGEFLLNTKFSSEIAIEKAVKDLENAKLLEESAKKVVKKRAPRKKKVVETIATEVNN